MSDARYLQCVPASPREGPRLIPRTVTTIFLDAGDTLIAYRRPLRVLLQDFFIEQNEIVRRDSIAEALDAVNSRYRSMMHGVRTVEAERRMWLEVARDLLDVVLPRRRDLYVALSQWFGESWKLMKVFRDVRPALRQLRANGYRLAVVSNWEPSLEEVLDHLGLRFHFTTVVTSSVEGVWKPEPRLFQIALERCGIAPEEAVSVGDNIERDVETARRTGLHAILLDRFNDHRDFIPRVASLSELVERFPVRVPQPR